MSRADAQRALDSWRPLACSMTAARAVRSVDCRAIAYLPSIAPCAKVCTNWHKGLQMSTTMTIRIEDEVKDRLDRLAESTQRSKSFLAAEAIREYVETNEWQIAEIRKALTEANGGDFASDKELTALARKWK